MLDKFIFINDLLNCKASHIGVILVILLYWIFKLFKDLLSFNPIKEFISVISLLLKSIFCKVSLYCKHSIIQIGIFEILLWFIYNFIKDLLYFNPLHNGVKSSIIFSFKFKIWIVLFVFNISSNGVKSNSLLLCKFNFIIDLFNINPSVNGDIFLSLFLDKFNIFIWLSSFKKLDINFNKSLLRYKLLKCKCWIFKSFNCSIKKFKWYNCICCISLSVFNIFLWTLNSNQL